LRRRSSFRRVLDGYPANAFLARWMEEIEGWG
jgi:hypothetical protein